MSYPTHHSGQGKTGQVPGVLCGGRIWSRLAQFQQLRVQSLYSHTKGGTLSVERRLPRLSPRRVIGVPKTQSWSIGSGGSATVVTQQLVVYAYHAGLGRRNNWVLVVAACQFSPVRHFLANTEYSFVQSFKCASLFKLNLNMTSGLIKGAWRGSNHLKDPFSVLFYFIISQILWGKGKNTGSNFSGLKCWSS